MLKKEFKKYFEDEEVEIKYDKGCLKSVKGYVYYQSICFKLSIHRNEEACEESKNGKKDRPRLKPVFTGTVSIIDSQTNRVMLSELKKRKRDEKGKESAEKDLYLSTVFRCNSVEDRTFMDTLMKQIGKMLKDNDAQLQKSIEYSMTPEKMTLQYAVRKYGENYLRIFFPNSAPERNRYRFQTMNKIAGLLIAVPIGQLRAIEVASTLKNNKITTENQILMYGFVDYMINLGKMKGRNPFPASVKKEVSFEKEMEKALQQKGLDDEVFAKLIQLHGKKEIRDEFVAIALMISGFSLTEIRQFKWEDIKFVKGYHDFVVASYSRDQLIASIHDFSRPVIPDVGIYLKKAYRKLKEKEEKLDEKLILGPDISTVRISNEINNLLVRAGYGGKLGSLGRPSKEETIPISILRDNYRRMLIQKAGLENDPDTVAFLTGTVLRNTTYTNYEDHTSPEAMHRFYTILQSISVEKKLKKESDNNPKEGKYIARPNTNHEIVNLTGTILLSEGEVQIRCKHGVTGRIDVKEIS